jgi:hypothetical protein
MNNSKFTIHFSGEIRIEATNELQAKHKLLELLSEYYRSGGYYSINEIKPEPKAQRKFGRAWERGTPRG